LPRPNPSVIYDVDASPDDVDTTRSITAELEHMVKKTSNQSGKNRRATVANAI